MERLYHYTYGRTITLETDHEALVSIWKKYIATASPKLQRLLLRLAHYEVDIKYLKGKSNVIADALSQVSSLTEYRNSDRSSETTDVIPVHQISSTVPVSELRL